jgi:hypothetical protein
VSSIRTLGRAAGVDEDDLTAGVAEPPRTAGDRAPSPVVAAEVNRPVERYQPVVQIDLDATLTDDPTWLDQGALGVDRSHFPVT